MTKKGHFTGQRLPAPWRPHEAAGRVSLWAPTCTGRQGVWNPIGRGPDHSSSVSREIYLELILLVGHSTFCLGLWPRGDK